MGARPRTAGLLVTAAVAGIGLIAFAPSADTGGAPANPEDAALERAIERVLLKKPEVLERALEGLQRWRAETAQVRAREQVAANTEALFADTRSPSAGPADAAVTIVEFVDYQCGYCRRMTDTIEDALARESDVRVVWKDLPVLGPDSRRATIAALAAHRQGRYHDMHLALIKTETPIKEGAIVAAAERVGLDLEAFELDRADPEIERYLEETRALANALEISGTPAFVIGREFYGGAMPETSFRRAIEEARARGG